MKVLLLSANDTTKASLEFHFRPLGLDIIRYSNPLKAMDNLDEIEPELVLVSATDFPRHWKPLLTLIRDSWSKDECVVILLKGPEFDYDEAAKAAFLETNGIIYEDFSTPGDIEQLKELITRYKSLRDGRSSTRMIVKDYDTISFMFSHPATFQFLTGRVIDISLTGLNFESDSETDPGIWTVGLVIEAASLRIGNSIADIDCKIVRHNRQIGFAFIDPSPRALSIIEEYLTDQKVRELSFIQSRS